jgi:hypothetical protein
MVTAEKVVIMTTKSIRDTYGYVSGNWTETIYLKLMIPQSTIGLSKSEGMTSSHNIADNKQY